MAGQTYSVKTLVLGKTKLGESNLIMRMLAEDGSLLEAVASGARKPKNASSARLELFNVVSLLMACGKTLDIVKETKLISSWQLLRTDPAYNAAASVVAEFAAKVAQPDLEAPRLFDLTAKTMEILAAASLDRLCLFVAAYLLKASAMAGSRPSLTECVVCGNAWHPDGQEAHLSLIDGGVVCSGCLAYSETETVPDALVGWAHHLLTSRFEDIDEHADGAVGADVLQLADRWVLTQYGIRLKSVGWLIQYCML